MIAVVDYRAGNLTSVRLALEHIGAACVVTSDPAEIACAERVIFPGVGAAAEAMENLLEMKLVEPLRAAVDSGRPFLGICLGTQVILGHSEEDGGAECLGILPGAARRFPPDSGCKIPHMGWNNVECKITHPMFDNIEQSSEFYFVHSYYPVPADPACVAAETTYAGVRFASVIARRNLFATQFHPERSGRIGLQLLRNFVTWDGRC